jgi:formiminoglutamate deiminase
VSYWCEATVVDGVVSRAVRITVGPDGRIVEVEAGVARSDDDVALGVVLPGAGNAHSHAFHRLLRGRTHDEGGDFWRWREAMYAAAARLDPTLYREVARAVFAEMLVCGYTAVGEFHYLHHRHDGTPYAEPHAMELALAQAARDVGIRLVLLDTVYLAGGIGVPLEPRQRPFGDGSAEGWLRRWHALEAALPAGGLVTLGAAIHSVRAVSRGDIRAVVGGLPPDVPLHAHVSEQPRENAESLAASGLSPVGVLADAGALGPRFALVHATHLSDADVAAVGAAGVHVVMCPTTEADLGDGIGPARRLANAGARIALGSDQNAVVDPFLEMRGLEAGERLSSGRRGCFDPAALASAASTGGYAALGLGSHALAVGDHCDLVEVDAASIRTAGSALAQLPLTATAADVRRVVVAGRVVADGGLLVGSNDRGDTARVGADPTALLRSAIAAFDAGADTAHVRQEPQ